jgi:4-hydroxy-tetrahydrodipicolinate synthase
MIYNNPWYSGVDMLPSLIERLAVFDNILYIKESTGDIKRVHEIIRRCGDKIDIWCGSDNLAYECLFMGCKGWIAPIANFLPKLSAKLYVLVEKGDYQNAKALYLKMLPILNYLEEGRLTAKVKEALNIIGQTGGKPRKPFLPIRGREKLKLKSMLFEI